MKTIGIDQNNFLIYEGNTFWGHGIWPSPTILPTYIFDFQNSDIKVPPRTDLLSLPYIFIDEGYDPSSRIRKGRIFRKWEQQPNQWHVYPHPAQHENRPNRNEETLPFGNQNVSRLSLVTFAEFNFFIHLEQSGIVDPCLILGTNNHHTIWTVVDAETSISGETILYIKSRKVLGALPKIRYDQITNEEDRKNIQEKIELLSIDLRNAAPDSVVDRCREAASAILNSYLLSEGHIQKRKDLGQLVNDVQNVAKKNLASNSAAILAKLHSRTKHIEQANRSTRNISEQDAEFAVQALSLIIIEIDWGHW